MSQLMSADGKWWWDWRQCQPVPVYGSPGAPGPMSSPWALKVAIAVNLVGSFLILLLGAVVAIGSRSAEFATGVGQAIGMDETTGLDLPTLVLVAGALVILYG